MQNFPIDPATDQLTNFEREEHSREVSNDIMNELLGRNDEGCGHDEDDNYTERESI